MEWKSLFRKNILESGYEYYECGTVSGLSVTNHGNSIEAAVKGSRYYDVCIDIEGDRIVNMD